jgi:hypothetical protein
MVLHIVVRRGMVALGIRKSSVPSQGAQHKLRKTALLEETVARNRKPYR